MPYKVGDRNQATLLPPSIEEYVGSDDPVRFYDAFIDKLDLRKLGLEYKVNQVGNRSYEPVTMLKILCYAYSYGWRSSRKIERALHHNLSFIWISGGLKPDDKTISEFRRHNKKLFKEVLKQTALVSKELGLVGGIELYIDGTKLRGNCSLTKSYSEESLRSYVNRLEQEIEKILESCESADEEESGTSMVRMSKELSDKQNLHAKISRALNDLEKLKGEKKDSSRTDGKKINITDKDAVGFKSRQGYHAGYNIQSTVDGKHGIILNAEATSNSNDTGELGNQLSKVKEEIGVEPKVVCADAGYSKVEDIKEVFDMGVEPVIPNREQSYKEKRKNRDNQEGEFSKNKFVYNKDNDTYTCPENQVLIKQCDSADGRSVRYGMKDTAVCRRCIHFNKCTKNTRGRTLKVSSHEDIKEMAMKIYDSERGKEIYRRRKIVAEMPFAHIKRNMGVTSFLLRGIDGANTEASLFASSFNITRIINLLGGIKNAIEAITRIHVNTNLPVYS